MRTTMSRGLRAISSLTWMPMRERPLALKFSMNTSEISASRMSSSRPSAPRVSIVQDSLFRQMLLFSECRLKGRSGRPGTKGA